MADDLAEFDHHSPEFAQNWREIYRTARGVCPVVHSDLYDGYDVLIKHADVKEAFRDYESFASERLRDEDDVEMDGGVGIPEHPFRIGFLEMDPPDSLSLRRIVNPWFSPRTIAAARPRIDEAVTWAVDQVIERGECDLITDLASPFQCMVVLDLLGIPLDRWKAYKEVIDKEVAQEDDAIEGIQWILGDLFDEVVQQREHGGEGLIAQLAVAEVDGVPIEDDLTAELVLMLLLGGMDTTIATIGHAISHLDTHRDDRQRLTDDPSIMATAVEEILRFYSPATAMGRTVRKPVTIAGKQYERGDRVLCAIASANQDEDAFTDAHVMDITRTPNPHLTFGTGTHRCIGMDLARVNTELFLNAVLARLGDYEVLADQVRIHDSIPHANGFTSMPMRFTKGERSRPSDGTFPTFSAPRILPV
jgi:cytochrome P450